MTIFQRPHYQSEATQFLNELKKNHPYLDQQQQDGRALLWDKDVNRSVWREYRAAKVEQKPYVYQTEADPNL